MFFRKRSQPATNPEYPRFPLDLRPGAIMAVDTAEVLRFAAPGFAWTVPQGEVLVEALSSSRLFDLTIVRAYARQGEQALLVQFNCDNAGSVLDIGLFGLIEEIRPATPEDWALWLDAGGLIGGADLNAPNGQTYLRQWGEGDYAAPVEMDEAVFTDPAQPPRRLGHQMMLYARDVAGENENMLLSADEEAEQALVRAWIGVDMTPYGVKVY